MQSAIQQRLTKGASYHKRVLTSGGPIKYLYKVYALLFTSNRYTMKKYMWRLGIVLMTFPLFLLSASCQQPGNRKEWMRQSSLIFEGEVMLLNSSTIDHPSPAGLGVVKVTEVLQGDMLQPYLNQVITVKFANPGQLKRGDKAMFYANGWLSGESIAVMEVGHEPLQNTDTRKNVNTERMQLQEDSLVDRLKKAELVIMGQVTTVKPLPVENKKESEHDPVWMIAEVKTNEVLKNASRTADTNVVRFVFAASNDVMWYRAPKFSEGHRGIWLLSKESPGFAEVRNYYTVIDPQQSLGINQRDRIFQLKNRIQ